MVWPKKEVCIIQILTLQKYGQDCPASELMDVLTNGIEDIFRDSLCSILILNNEDKAFETVPLPIYP